MWIILKVCISLYLQVLLLFYVFGCLAPGMWDLSFLTRAWICTSCIGRWSPNTGHQEVLGTFEKHLHQNPSMERGQDICISLNWMYTLCMESLRWHVPHRVGHWTNDWMSILLWAARFEICQSDFCGQDLNLRASGHKIGINQALAPTSDA